MATRPLPPVTDAEPTSAFAAVLADTPDTQIETQVNQVHSWSENETTLFEAASTAASPAQVECQPDALEEAMQRRSCSHSVSPLVVVPTPSGEHICSLSKVPEDVTPAVSPKLWPLAGPEAEPSPVPFERLLAAEPSFPLCGQRVAALIREQLSAVELSSMPSPEHVQFPAVLVSSPRGSILEATSKSGNEEVQGVIGSTLVADAGLKITFSKTPSLTQASRRPLSRSISPIVRQKTQTEQAVANCSQGCGSQEASQPRDETEPHHVFLHPPRPNPRQAGVGPRSASPIKCMPRQGSVAATTASLQSPAAAKLKFGPEAEPSPVTAEAYPRTQMLASGQVPRASTSNLPSASARSPRCFVQQQCGAEAEHSKPQDNFFGKDTRESLLAIQEKAAKYEELLDQLDLALQQLEKASAQDCNAVASPVERCLELEIFLERFGVEDRDLLRFMPLSRWSIVRRRELHQRCVIKGFNVGLYSEHEVGGSCTGDGRRSLAAGAVGIGALGIVPRMLVQCISRKAPDESVMFSP